MVHDGLSRWRLKSAVIALCLGSFTQVCALSPQGDETTSGNNSRGETYDKLGFSTDDKLKPILNALDEERFEDARTLATELIARPVSFFRSKRSATFIRALAYQLRASAADQLGNNADALADYQQSADLGDAASAYQVARRCVTKLAGTRDPSETRDSKRTAELKELVHSYFRMGAELGHAAAIARLWRIYKLEGRDREAAYWIMVEATFKPPEDIRRFLTAYNDELTDSDRAFFQSSFTAQSLTGGAVSSQVSSVPGRSILTAALVENLMRRQLQMVWRALVYADTAAEAEPTLLEVYNTHRDAVPTTPFAEVYLFVRGERTFDEARVLGLKFDDLKKSILPGDGLIVRCGRLVHYATVWSINTDTDEALLLDPFHQFWYSTHNRCVSKSSVEEYRYHRTLVRVPIADIERMLVALIAVRDRL